MKLIEFLNARITEDEVDATLRAAHKYECDSIMDEAGYSYPCECGVPERMKAECAAKRAILDLGNPDAIKCIALAYVNDPDFQQEWIN